MGDLSESFNREEFSCKCGCGFDVVDAGLLNLLEEMREHFDRPIWIESGARCREHNIGVGGGDYSQHLLGKAADIVVDGTPPELVQELARQMGAGGVGSYSTFTHIDVRSGISRWSV